MTLYLPVLITITEPVLLSLNVSVLKLFCFCIVFSDIKGFYSIAMLTASSPRRWGWWWCCCCWCCWRCDTGLCFFLFSLSILFNVFLCAVSRYKIWYIFLNTSFTSEHSTRCPILYQFLPNDRLNLREIRKHSRLKDEEIPVRWGKWGGFMSEALLLSFLDLSTCESISSNIKRCLKN